VTSGKYKAEFSETREYNYRFAWNGAAVEFEARFDTTAAVSIGVETTYSGVKETIILLDSSAPTRLEWALTVTGEVYEVPGGWGVYNSDGQLGFLIHAANARDAKGRTVPVKTTLEKGVLVADVDTKGAVFPVAVDPTVTTNIVGAQSGYATKDNATYLTARNSTTSDGVDNATLTVGQDYYASAFGVYRSFLSFPIASNAATATACTLFVHGIADYSTTEFTIHLYGARKYKPTLTTADFQNFSNWAASGTYDSSKVMNVPWHSASYAADFCPIIFNSTGLDSLKVAKGDTLWAAMLSNRDVRADQPAGNELVQFFISGNTPYLSYTYTIPAINSPTNFLMTPIAGAKDSMLVSWTNNHSSSIDSLILKTYPDSQRVTTLTKTASTARIGGLNPYQKYRWYVRADSAGVYGYSNADSMWTCQTFKTENFSFVNYGYAQNAATAVYDSARGETKSDSLSNGNTYLGQWWYNATTKYLLRHYQDIALPKLVRVQAESLFIAGTTDSTYTDFNIVARAGTWNGGTVAKMKYTLFDGWQTQMTPYTGSPLITAFSTAGFTTGATLNKLVFLPAGMDTTLKHGIAPDTLRVMLLSSKDVSATAPTVAEYVIINEANSYLRLTYAPPDSAPGGFTLTSISTDSLLATWTDRSYTERGFIIVDATAGTIVAGTDTTEQNVTSKRIGGLLPNTKYVWKVKAVGGDANGLLSAADSCYTRAATPGKPTTSKPTDALLKFVLDVNGNPAYTEFAVQDSISGKYVDPISGVIDTFKVSATWRTYAGWGGAAGDTVAVGVGKKYTLRVKAKSGQ
jgi:hypothetical protein